MTTAREDLAAKLRETILSMVERVPVSESADEGTIACVDNGARRVVGKFVNGAWVSRNGRALTIAPTHWMRIRK